MINDEFVTSVRANMNKLENLARASAYRQCAIWILDSMRPGSRFAMREALVDHLIQQAEQVIAGPSETAGIERSPSPIGTPCSE